MFPDPCAATLKQRKSILLDLEFVFGRILIRPLVFVSFQFASSLPNTPPWEPYYKNRLHILSTYRLLVPLPVHFRSIFKSRPQTWCVSLIGCTSKAYHWILKVFEYFFRREPCLCENIMVWAPAAIPGTSARPFPNNSDISDPCLFQLDVPNFEGAYLDGLSLDFKNVRRFKKLENSSRK